ncbi:hypothetical protein AAFF88_05735 [Hyphobacterium sp. WM6]|uniref:Holin n=2 Tax=Hyphobacterium vulgare TaxID=1736751 RepID=A0ABV6ZUN7_9PROT
MFRAETQPRRRSFLPAIRALIVAIPAAMAAYYGLEWFGAAAPWPELAGAMAGGFLVGKLSRR